MRSDRVRRALVSKGMIPTDSHHHMFRRTVDGVTQLVTRLSHGEKEVTERTARLMAKQCVLHFDEFTRLVECPLSPEEWDNCVRERCVDGRNPFIGR